jgi:hypothetical protein
VTRAKSGLFGTWGLIAVWVLGASRALAAADAPADAASLYELPYKGPVQVQALIDAGVDVVAFTRDQKLHVSATPDQRSVLERFDPNPRLLRAPGPQIAALDANLGAYRTYNETTVVLQGLQAAHPSLAALSIIGTTIEGRAIYALKVSDNVGVDEPEPEVLIMGCHHARELMSVEMPLHFAEYLLAQYGTDPQVTQLVNGREIWIVPIVNPDGYVFVQNNHIGDSSNWWRKNRRNNGNGTFGVDLNRNYGYNWGYDNIGSSPTPGSAVYRGTAPFSEPETQAVRNLCNARHFTTWLTYHSYGDLLLFPWGYAFDYTTDHEIMLRMGERLAAGTDYLVGNPATGAIYLTNGASDDWGYGEAGTKPRLFGFTPEVNSLAEGGFAPPESLIGPTFAQLLPMNLRLLELAAEPEQVLGPVTPALESVHATPGNQLVLAWTDNVPSDPNPAAMYDLELFKNPGWQAADGAESPSAFVDIQGGVAISTARAFAGTHSYYYGHANNLSSTLALVSPWRVTSDHQTLSCRMWYDIELDFDYAYVEVSTDEGLIWRPIAGNITTQSNPNGSNRGNGITGSSGGWVTATFSLAGYVGQEILLRIHYSTDGGVLGEGLYVDQLGPVPSFEQHATLATGVAGTSFAFTPSSSGDYLYRVRGADAAGDLSRWSPVLEVQVQVPVDILVLPPVETALGRNEPNPFNPSTTIPYTVGARRGDGPHDVDLGLYDALGRRIATLVRGPLPAGHYRAHWDGRTTSGRMAASGTYFARLIVDGDPARVRKLQLLR